MKNGNIKKDVLPLVSIIIPTYNDAQHILESIESAIDQSYKNIELIIIDDGSTDNTQSLINGITGQGLQYYKTENKGAAAARNLGLLKANGQYVQYLDSDDILGNNKIELQLNKMLTSEADISFSLWQDLIQGTFSKDEFEFEFEFEFEDVHYQQINTGREMIRSFGMDNWYIPVFSWLTKRCLIEQAGPWDENLTNNDDGEFFLRVLLGAKKIVSINKILGYYRRSENISLSNYNTENKVHSAFKSYKKIEKHIRFNKQDELLCYPKRQFYIQYRMIKRQYPHLAKKSAKAFDSINSDCFLIEKKRFWWCVKNFGLEKGIIIYNILLKGMELYRKIR